MSQTYGGVCRIDTLSSVSGCTEYIEFACRSRSSCTSTSSASGMTRNGDRGGVDSAAGLGLRHALYTVYAGLVLQLRSTRPGQLIIKLTYLHTADSDLFHVH